MNDKNVVLMISSMFAGCTETQKNKLEQLYKQAFTNTKEYKRIVDLRANYDAFGTIGKDLLIQGETALQNGISHPNEYTNNLTIIENVLLNSEKYINETDEYINGLNCYNKPLYLIEKSKGAEMEAFFKHFMNVFCYTTAVLYGVDSLKDVSFDPNAGSIDMLKNMNEECTKVITTIINKPIRKPWRIVRKQFVGANMIKYNGFVLEYMNSLGSLSTEEGNKITPLLSTSNNDLNVVCFGVGDLTNLRAENGLSVIGSTVTKSFPENALDEMNLDYNNINIVEILNSISSVNIGFISPENMVRLLNRYFMIQTVKQRNMQQKCIYCGGINCNHFKIPQTFRQ